MRLQGSTALTTGTSNNNVLSGSILEFVKRQSMVKFYVVASAVGGLASVSSGADILLEESAVSQANRFPVDPDDLTVKDVAMPGDRLKLALRNPTGGTVTFYWAVEVQPV